MTEENPHYRIQQILKRLMDLVIMVSSLILVFPLMVIIAFAIKMDSEGPVLYRHRRVGKDGVLFDLFKFRSMVHGGDDKEYLQYLQQLILSERENNGNALPYRKLNGDPRVTRFGRFLRRYYLDELPQILNILRGDMSLVGPRPHVQFEVDHYTEGQCRRLTAKPGATGLWQVTSKADSSFNELINLDLKYIDEWSLWLDFKIILMTMGVVLRGGEEFWTRMAKRIPAKTPSKQPPSESLKGSAWPTKAVLSADVPEEDLHYSSPSSFPEAS